MTQRERDQRRDKISSSHLLSSDYQLTNSIPSDSRVICRLSRWFVECGWTEPHSHI